MVRNEWKGMLIIGDDEHDIAEAVVHVDQPWETVWLVAGNVLHIPCLCEHSISFLGEFQIIQIILCNC